MDHGSASEPLDGLNAGADELVADSTRYYYVACGTHVAIMPSNGCYVSSLGTQSSSWDNCLVVSSGVEGSLTGTITADLTSGAWLYFYITDSDGNSERYQIIARFVEVSGITVTASPVYIYVGESVGTTACQASYSPSNASNPSLTWDGGAYGTISSTGTGSDNSVVAVSTSYGITTSVRTTTVTCSAGDGSGASGSATLTLAQRWNIKYDANGGSGAPSTTTMRYTTYSSLRSITISSTVPTRSGYEFLGWSSSSTATTADVKAGASASFASTDDDGNAVYDAPINKTLYAVWKEEEEEEEEDEPVYAFVLTYDANGGTGAPSDQTYTGTTTSHTFTISSTKPTRDGYTFLGWATNSWTATAEYQPGGTFTVDTDSDVDDPTADPVVYYDVLYAVWGGNEVLVTALTISSPSTTTGDTVTLYATTSPSTATDRSVTWSIIEGSSIATISGTTTTSTGGTCTLTLTGVGTVTVRADANDGSGVYGLMTLSIDNLFTLAYDANGGSGAPSSQSYTGASTSHTFVISSTEPTRDGYTFMGWSTSSTATAAEYLPGDSYTITTSGTANVDITLYAVWGGAVPVESITLTSDPDGVLYLDGTATVSATVRPVNADDRTVKWSVGGYGKLSASDSSACTVSSSGGLGESERTAVVTATANDGSGVSASEELVLTQRITLSYNANGGSGAPTSGTTKYRTTSTATVSFTLSRTTPVRDGYVFKGWGTTATATGGTAAGGTYTASASSMSTTGAVTVTLYAIWSERSSVGDTLVLVYSGVEYDLGTVTSISAAYSKSTSDTPIVSRSTEDTISIESDSRIVVTASTVRVDPGNGDTYDRVSQYDTAKWSNAYWYEWMHNIVDRWQARTNGFTLRYTPGPDNPYVPEMEYNGFVKSMTRTYKQGESSTLRLSLEFHVGTMVVGTGKSSRASTDDDGTTSISEFQVLMSDSAESSWYALLSGGEDEDDTQSCVTEMTLYGGVQQPFETLTLTVPRNRLKTYAPDLVDDITAGRNRIQLVGFGDGSYTVVKCRLKSKTYTITAYNDAERLRGYSLDTDMAGRPLSIINSILTSGEYGVAYDNDHIVRWYDESNSSVTLDFEKGTNAWYALQVAAMAMGCRVWFADSKAYVADLRGDYSGATLGTLGDDSSEFFLGDVDLYPESASAWTYNRTTGSPELGDEGMDTVVNSITVYHSDGDGGTESDMYTDEESIAVFGERSGTSVSLSGFSGTAAEAFADAYLSYRREPQQSVTFTFKEYTSDGNVRWARAIPPLAFASSISSGPDEFEVTNVSDITGEPTLQKLTLSEYTRTYPDGTTEYSFGILDNIDLSTSTSQILSSRGA